MRFKYRVIWINTGKNRQEKCDVDDQNIALFVAKQKVSLGMQNVIIQVYGELGDDPDDTSWPAIEAETEEIKKENQFDIKLKSNKKNNGLAKSPFNLFKNHLVYCIVCQKFKGEH